MTAVSLSPLQSVIALVWGDLIAAFQDLKGAYRKAGKGLFIRAGSKRTKGNSFKLEEGRFRLDTRKKFFTVRVVIHWNRLPSKAADLPSPEREVQGQVGWGCEQPDPAYSRGLELGDLRGPFQPKPFYVFASDGRLLHCWRKILCFTETDHVKKSS